VSVRHRETLVQSLEHEAARLRAHTDPLRTGPYEAQNQQSRRTSDDYAALRERVHEAVSATVPAGETVLVVTKGDAELLEIERCEAWHFPRQSDGRYSGYYPKRDISAIAHLEAGRAHGASYLIIPSTSRWWLHHYRGFRLHLERCYERVFDDADVGVVFAIRDAAPRRPDLAAELDYLLESAFPDVADDPWILDCVRGSLLKTLMPERKVVSPVARTSALPYLDGTFDVVIVPEGDEQLLDEAERVAARMVVTLAEEGPHGDRPRLRAKAARETPAAPNVSIIVASRGGDVTQSFVRHLCDTLPQWFAGEIIVVGSAVEAKPARNRVRNDPRLRLIPRGHRTSRLDAFNQGARQADGDYLIFVADVAALLPGWLMPLLAAQAASSDVGAVGAKLLREDGTIYEAGGRVLTDATTERVGGGDPDVEAPQYDYRREADYVSAGVFLTTSSLFEEIGGFETRHGDEYGEADYCLAARALGRQTYYEPESVAVVWEHVVGAARAKRDRARRRSSFHARWRRDLEAALEPGDGSVSVRRRSLARRPGRG